MNDTIGDKGAGVMRAAVCRTLGAIESISVETIPRPSIGHGQLRVAVLAAGISYMDVLLAKGAYQVAQQPPYVPGSEFVGRVTEVADGVADAAVGDLVVGQSGGGAFAEELVTAAVNVGRLPAGIPYLVAATMLQSYSTAIYTLTRRSPVDAGDRVLVLGAGGGVGLAAIDVAHSMGALVIGAASTEAKRQRAIEAGADFVIDTSREDLKHRARELADGKLSVVVDPVGGPLAEQALRALDFGGRHLVLGFADAIPSIALNWVLLNSRSVVGVEFGAAIARSPGLAWEINRAVLDSVASGRLRPTTPTTVPLNQVSRAFRLLDERRAVGKVALIIDEERTGADSPGR